MFKLCMADSTIILKSYIYYAIQSKSRLTCLAADYRAGIPCFVCVFDESTWKNICVTQLFLLCQILGFICNNKSASIEDLEDRMVQI